MKALKYPRHNEAVFALVSPGSAGLRDRDLLKFRLGGSLFDVSSGLLWFPMAMISNVFLWCSLISRLSFGVF